MSCTRIPLYFLQRDKLREVADNYIRPLLTKGVPSLFSDLSYLYNHPGKCARPISWEIVQDNAYDQDPYAKEFGIKINEKLAQVESMLEHSGRKGERVRFLAERGCEVAIISDEDFRDYHHNGGAN
ncbi:N-alpha-acetyltransferase 16, NatA auxiliary subunit [Stylosanthes scabra]|uniref:N-alpha-acetyltransferase 16, NatA auxiliary subunit n=1 Tax=Stylosanthes scabra TaxID=79078 RepID=A0ABU6ZH81_9FABA|nr:N-alpha-acetyltransferase 16, NatA auxiliary subunit [Stylosanthes scabra]